MDVRASDRDRDATIEHLRDAAADGRLTLEELTDRIEAASHAMMRSELAVLLRDLAPDAGSSDPKRVRVRKVGDIKHEGAWVVPCECRFRSYLGNVTVDLREATITSQETRLDVRAVGNIVLLIPEGLVVEVPANELMGRLKQKQTAAARGAPRIILTGGTRSGEVKITHQRMWEKVLKRR